MVGRSGLLDDKARLASAGRYDILTGLGSGGCDCVTRGGDRWLTEMLGWSIVVNEILQGDYCGGNY